MFVDEAVILLRSGKGGNGCVSFRREKFVPRGGPDGGDGGPGGHVILEADPQLSTLIDVSRRSLYKAENGRPGQGSNRTGRQGEDLVIQVPVGTIVRAVREGEEPSEGPILADLSRAGQSVVAARGGKPGRGNKSFASATNQVPMTSTEGGKAIECRVYLELKLLADAGLIGLPNAGKSTLLSRLSAARPKIASYPFTTLHPNLGISELSDMRRLVFADIPGLIEGAHEGHGLGIEFLRHVHRTRVLVHLVSVEDAGSVDTLVDRYRTVEAELAGFDAELARKPRCVLLSKCDLLPADRAAEFARELGARLNTSVLSISSATGSGLREFVERVDTMLKGSDQ